MNFDYVVAPVLIVMVALCVSWFCLRRMLVHVNRYGKWRRITERVVLSLVIVVAVAVAGSTAFNALAIHHYRATNPPPGKLHAVDGYKMHIYCTGNGSPTLVLEAGGGGRLAHLERGSTRTIKNHSRVLL